WSVIGFVSQSFARVIAALCAVGKGKMKKVKIKVCSLGALPREFDKDILVKIKSKVFDIVPEIHSYNLRVESDLYEWAYSDEILSTQIPSSDDSDILIVLTSIPLEENYYSRRLQDNVVIFTFYEISNYLKLDNIPLENVIKRLFYSYSLVYLRNNKKIPMAHELSNFTHDDTRGCIYDMNGVKEDVTSSCHKPIICEECCERMRNEKISSETLEAVKSELTKITKNRFYVIADLIKQYPIASLILSSLWAVVLGVTGSLIANAVSGA
ncbi:hypothetical protein, partial [Aliivibrio fischeri]|uniref:hypothetical protein n=3 Tax=Aliivibrio fischeri TaxID=668 RepID=UPI001F1606A6